MELVERHKLFVRTYPAPFCFEASLRSRKVRGLIPAYDLRRPEVSGLP